MPGAVQGKVGTMLFHVPDRALGESCAENAGSEKKKEIYIYIFIPIQSIYVDIYIYLLIN